jgi:hypothetical protein
VIAFGDSIVIADTALPPRDIQILLDEEFSQIEALLQPGLRRGHEAKARLRSLLIIQSSMADHESGDGRDISGLEKSVRKGATRDELFPGLRGLRSAIDGSGININVRFGKSGPEVRHSTDEEAFAIREVDLHQKYYLSASKLATRLDLNGEKCKALRERLKIDDDTTCANAFSHNRTRYVQYSDNALRLMKQALAELSMDEVLTNYRMDRAHKQAAS